MQQSTTTPVAKWQQRRRFFLLLPLIMLPAAFLFFFSVRGMTGKTTPPPDKTSGTHGYNTDLPAAHFSGKDPAMDKMQAYQKAVADSIRKETYSKLDPYRSAPVPVTTTQIPAMQPANAANAFPEFPATNTVNASNNPAQPDPASAALLQKMAALSRSIHAMTGEAYPLQSSLATNGSHARDPLPIPAAAPLANNWRQSLSHDTALEKDAQLERLNGMLDKIIRIQQGNNPDTPLARPDHPSPSAYPAEAIPALVQEDQTLVAGSTLALRITAPVSIDSIRIPRDQLVYGQVRISNDRMLVEIHSLRQDDRLYFTNLQVYDLDGLPGIHIPGSASREVTKQSADQGISALSLMTMDPSIEAQATQAGIQTAKSLLSRKVKTIRIAIRAGYQVLLRNTQAPGRPGWMQVSARQVVNPQTMPTIDLPDSNSSNPAAMIACLPPAYLHRSVHQDRLRLTLRGVYLLTRHPNEGQGKLLAFVFQLENRSPIDFLPAYSRWFIRDQHRLARTAQQETNLRPLANSLPEKLPGDSACSFIVTFPPFALARDKTLVWQLSEANGARLMTIDICPSLILDAQPQYQSK